MHTSLKEIFLIFYFCLTSRKGVQNANYLRAKPPLRGQCRLGTVFEQLNGIEICLFISRQNCKATWSESFPGQRRRCGAKTVFALCITETSIWISLPCHYFFLPRANANATWARCMIYAAFGEAYIWNHLVYVVSRYLVGPLPQVCCS